MLVMFNYSTKTIMEAISAIACILKNNGLKAVTLNVVDIKRDACKNYVIEGNVIGKDDMTEEEIEKILDNIAEYDPEATWKREADIWFCFYLAYDDNMRHADNSFHNNGLGDAPLLKLREENRNWYAHFLKVGVSEEKIWQIVPGSKAYRTPREITEMTWFNISSQEEFRMFADSLKHDSYPTCNYLAAALLNYDDGKGYTLMIELQVPTARMFEDGENHRPWLNAYEIKRFGEYDDSNEICSMWDEKEITYDNAEELMIELARSLC